MTEKNHNPLFWFHDSLIASETKWYCSSPCTSTNTELRARGDSNQEVQGAVRFHVPTNTSHVQRLLLAHWTRLPLIFFMLQNTCWQENLWSWPSSHEMLFCVYYIYRHWRVSHLIPNIRLQLIHCKEFWKFYLCSLWLKRLLYDSPKTSHTKMKQNKLSTFQKTSWCSLPVEPVNTFFQVWVSLYTEGKHTLVG